MKTNRVIPQFAGYQFTISFLADHSGTEVKWYGYNIKGNGRQEAGGAYHTIEAATRACLARIETLAFDAKHKFLREMTLQYGHCSQ